MTRENGFHQLWHHFASVLLRDGVNVRTPAEYLGHTDPLSRCGFADTLRHPIDRAFSEAADHAEIAQEGETAL